jgi:hypothetical protein
MVLRNIVCGVLIVAVAILSGCSKSKVYPDGPGMATGTTDSDGIANVELGPYIIDIIVVNTAYQPLTGMNARAYLLQDHLLAIASSPSGSHYSSMTIISYDEAQSNAKPSFYPASGGGNSPHKAARPREIEITVVMPSAGLSSYGFDPEVPNANVLETDAWIDPVAQDYQMEELYSLADSVDYSGGTILHLTSEVSYNIGSGRQTATFLMDRISDLPTFASLVSLELRMFDGDTIHTRILNYQDNPMPILVVDDLVMNRNFLAQFTLTWGENPSDLDSHIWTPQIEGSSYHIYYASRGNSIEPPFVDLDVDDVTSYGPEHITIYNGYPGTYTYAIYHYAGSGDITTSEAEVGVLDPEGGVTPFVVPEGSAAANWWWHVCTIDGETGVITPINEISPNPPVLYAMPPFPSKANVD